jgi:hypothetical protein
LFASAQTQLQENRKRARLGQRGARYLLQGLLVCGQCGYAYYGKAISQKAAKGKEREYAYYRCIGTDAYRFGGERICDNHQLRTDLLDQQVWEEVCHLLKDHSRLQQEYERRLNTSGKENENLAHIQAQRSKIQQGMTRLIDSYAEGYIQKQEFEPRIMRLRQRQTDVEQQEHQIIEEEISKEQLQQAICRLEEFHKKVKDELVEADWQMRRDLIQTLVRRVDVGKDEVNVVFRIPSRRILPIQGETNIICNIVRRVISPLLSNVMLDDLDRELEKRGHKFVRYADDCAPRRARKVKVEPGCTRDEGGPLGAAIQVEASNHRTDDSGRNQNGQSVSGKRRKTRMQERSHCHQRLQH